MTAERSYSCALSHEEAGDELERCAGARFDPAVVQAFLRRARRPAAPRAA